MWSFPLPYRGITYTKKRLRIKNKLTTKISNFDKDYQKWSRHSVSLYGIHIVLPSRGLWQPYRRGKVAAISSPQATDGGKASKKGGRND